MAEAFLAAIPAHEYPYLHRMATHAMTVGYDEDADFDFGLGPILDGLEGRSHGSGATPNSSGDCRAPDIRAHKVRRQPARHIAGGTDVYRLTGAFQIEVNGRCQMPSRIESGF